MTSCIVGKKIRAIGPGPLELFPFVVLAILMAMAFICVKDISGTTLPTNLKFFLKENICYGYSLEVTHRGTSNEFPQHMFSLKSKKNVNFRASNSLLDKLILTIYFCL